MTIWDTLTARLLAKRNRAAVAMAVKVQPVLSLARLGPDLVVVLDEPAELLGEFLG